MVSDSSNLRINLCRHIAFEQDELPGDYFTSSSHTSVTVLL